MSEFNFKSQLCTSREQSERLLALGLKKETADMCWTKKAAIRGTFYEPELAPINMVAWRHTPAWSLHRLIEMVSNSNAYSKGDWLYGIAYNAYEKLIESISEMIHLGYFNKEYLIDQAEIEERCKGVLEYLDYIRGEEE